MMNVRDFTEEMRNEIVEAAHNSLMKIGIMADVAMILNEEKNLIKLETARFNTTPVIYKSIEVSGSANLVEVEGKEGVYDLAFGLDYRFKYFGGGSNGVPIGVLSFRVFEKTERIAVVGFII